MRSAELSVAACRLAALQLVWEEFGPADAKPIVCTVCRGAISLSMPAAIASAGLTATTCCVS